MNSNNSRNSGNNYKRRSSKNNKNYKQSSNKNYKQASNKNSKNSKKKNENQHKVLEDVDFSVTKQQVFDFDEMKFSDEIDTSFVENKRKKKEQIVNELTLSFEKGKELQKKKDEKTCSKVHIGTVLAFLVLLFFLLASLVVCYYLLTKPVNTKVVTKEKEVVVLDDNYLFLGDFITEQYDLEQHFLDMKVVNSGVSDSQTKDILDNLRDRAYQYNPSKIFLLIGINDIQEGVDSEEIVDNIKKILSELKINRPYAELYLEAIYPVDEEKSEAQGITNEEIRSINKSLTEYCKNSKITFIDTFNLLLDSEADVLKIKDEYTEDGLHITTEGYEVITKEIMKYIK